MIAIPNQFGSLCPENHAFRQVPSFDKRYSGKLILIFVSQKDVFLSLRNYKIDVMHIVSIRSTI